MTRRRWLRVYWPFDMRGLAERLKSLPFTISAQNGFIIDRVRAGSLEGRFIERQEISQIVESPLGDKITYERTEFRELGFIAEIQSSILEIINPPRSMTVFLSRLAEACEFQISIGAINIDVLDWCERLSSALGQHSKIVTCQLRDIRITEDIMASAILKGSSDVREAVKLITNGTPYINDKIKVQIDGPPLRSLILTRQGAANLDKNVSEGLLEALRNSLYASTSITGADGVR